MSARPARRQDTPESPEYIPPSAPSPTCSEQFVHAAEGTAEACTDLRFSYEPFENCWSPDFTATPGHMPHTTLERRKELCKRLTSTLKNKIGRIRRAKPEEAEAAIKRGDSILRAPIRSSV